MHLLRCVYPDSAPHPAYFLIGEGHYSNKLQPDAVVGQPPVDQEGFFQQHSPGPSKPLRGYARRHNHP